MKIKVLLHPVEEGGFWAEVPSLPGCVSEGDDLTSALSNARDAARAWIEFAPQASFPQDSVHVAEIEL